MRRYTSQPGMLLKRSEQRLNTFLSQFPIFSEKSDVYIPDVQFVVGFQTVVGEKCRNPFVKK